MSTTAVVSTTGTATASSTSRTPDAQTWVYPPPGPSVLPIGPTSNMPPVSFGDTMLLEWTPETRPEIYMTCFTLSLRQTTIKVVTAGAARTPFNYQFGLNVNSTGPADLAYCHYWFNPSSDGNSGNFQYVNEAASTATTFGLSSRASATASSSGASRSGSASTTASGAGASNSSGANSQAAGSGASTSDGSSSGLSSGAKAGIGIGVALGIIALMAVIFLLVRRRRQQRGALPPSYEAPGEMQADAAYAKPVEYSVYEKRLSTPPVELDAGVVGHELPGHLKTTRD